MDNTSIQLQDAWLHSLKSGGFKQTREQLVSKDGPHLAYCCLGVACVVHNEQASRLNLTLLSVSTLPNSVMFDGKKSYLPPAAIECFGFRTYAGHFKESVRINDYTYDSLSDMNDGCMSFAEIAAYVEANRENVFENK